MRLKIDDAAEPTLRDQQAPKRFAPAGQSTQMIVGADGATDAAILDAAPRSTASYG